MVARSQEDDGGLPLRNAWELEQRCGEQAWLIEGLWAANGAGLLGAEPKCMKSWLALDMAVSVATGEPCLRKFRVPEAGPVLYFPAEDAEHTVRARVESIAATIGLTIEQVPLTFVAVSELRLDTDKGRDLLRRCAEHVRPKLLVVDPFVRVTQADENSASGVGEVLQFLRTLQRELSTAVLLVHHNKKGGANVRPGQALRGSGDLHAFGDCNLFLARDGDSVLLTAEHRASPGFENLELQLKGEGDQLALHALDFRLESAQPTAPRTRARAVQTPKRKKRDVPAEVRKLIAQAQGPLNQRHIREQLGCRMEAVNTALRSLQEQGAVVRVADGYRSIDESAVESNQD